MVRNRFTIDTDIVFDGEPEPDLTSPEITNSSPLQRDGEPGQRQQSELAGDTDRWVEEQFDLEEYEEKEEVKETDILSDDDDQFCRTPGELSSEGDLEAPIAALSLESRETGDEESLKSTLVCETGYQKQANEEKNDSMEQTGQIWIRRKQSDSSPDCGM